jgi:hypothetical protein
MRTVPTNKIPFGLKNGKLVHVSEVDSGLACDCLCPSCSQNLQANKGKMKCHHFSHDPSSKLRECKSAFETSIHLMAKEILSEDAYIIVPDLTISLSKNDVNGGTYEEEISVEKESRINFDRVEIEKQLGDIRPDIIAYNNEITLLIEIAVTSFAGIEKKRKIRNRGINAIEIDLSSVDYTITKTELRELINSSSTKKRWLSNPKVIKAKNKLTTILDGKINLINKKIHNNRNKSAKQFNQIGFPIHNKSNIKALNNTQDSTRWFRCEACRLVFEVTLQNAPYSIKIIQCPECNHAVSAKL